MKDNQIQKNHIEYYLIDETHWWFSARKNLLEFVIKKFAKDLDTDCKVIDIGCGSGTNIKNFSSVYNNIVGMEDSEEAANMAKEKTGKQIYKGELPDKIPFEDNSFDLVFLLDVLEHIENDELTLININKKLKQNGYLALSVPAFNFLWNAHDEMFGHKRRYTAGELKNKLTKSGFKVEDISYYNFLLFPIMALVIFLKNKTSLIKSKNNFQIMNNKILNYILKLIVFIESFLLKFLKPFWGASIIAIAKKRAE